jgi:hypothetical protein
MATKRVKNENERLDDAHIERVIAMLEPAEGTKASSKKDCCQVLGISYNVTRLAALIEKYKERQVYEVKRRTELRGKPVTPDETIYIIGEYLEGATIDSISNSTFRPSGFIKRVLEDNAVPIRQSSHDYFRPELIPDGATRDRFTVGELVYSARYDSLARIDSEQETEKYGWIYRIYLLAERWSQSAYQEAYELASLEHLRKLGVRV